MTYGVKSSRKVEKAEAGDLLMAYCYNVVVSKDRGVVSVEFGMFGIGRLIMIVQGVR